MGLIIGKNIKKGAKQNFSKDFIFSLFKGIHMDSIDKQSNILNDTIKD